MRYSASTSSILLSILLILCSVVPAADSRKKSDLLVSMAERVRIWDEVVAKELGLSLPLRQPKPYSVSPNGLEATFEKDGAKWTIIGANAPIVNPTVYPKNWPVKGNDFEVLVIPEPITNYKILPFTEKIENAVKSDTITVTGAPDSYEPASFVIRSGDVDLKDVMIDVSDLSAKVKGKDGKTRTAVITKKNIDVRVVKCWYQAGIGIKDAGNKLMVPELLLHDDDLISVDTRAQVNLIKGLDTIQDESNLRPFVIRKKENKQIWLTVSFDRQHTPGKYTGYIKIVAGKRRSYLLKMTVNVLDMNLPRPALDYSFYYHGRYSADKKGRPADNYKNEKQMVAELRDMVAHGINNPTIRIDHSEFADGSPNLSNLGKAIELRKIAGILDSEPLLYYDVKVTHYRDIVKYKDKVAKIVNFAESKGIKEVYIYGKDEARGAELARMRQIYEAVHESGAKNFVAGSLDEFLKYVPDIVDLFVVHGAWDWQKNERDAKGPSMAQIAKARKLGMKMWLYAYPQAGMEQPATYRRNFGLNLLLMGMDGACNYAYQADDPWNDFIAYPYRSHTMAYPTVDQPISTLQWEGWRAGVQDVRYFTLLKGIGLADDKWIMENCAGVAKNCRGAIIAKILKRPI